MDFPINDSASYSTEWHAEYIQSQDHFNVEERYSYVVVDGTSSSNSEPTGIQNPSLSIGEMAKDDLASKTVQELDSNWELQKYFGHIKVISLNPLSERFQNCQNELAKVGLNPWDYEVFPGVDGSTLPTSLLLRVHDFRLLSLPDKQGRAGCIMAHYNAIKESAEKYEQAQENLKRLLQENGSAEEVEQAQTELKKYETGLFMEDNNAFGRLKGQIPDLTEEGVRFRKILSELPDDWDMFYFMTLPMRVPSVSSLFSKPQDPVMPFSTHLRQLNYGVVLKCYAVHAKAYRWILEHFEKYLSSLYRPVPPADHIVAELHSTMKCFAPAQALSYRYSSKSAVITDNDPTNHWQCDIENSPH